MSTAAPPDRVGYVKDRFGIGPIGSRMPIKRGRQV
jgi:hypothetical protein